MSGPIDMSTRLRAAGLVWATVLTIASAAFLCGLGTWQMQRKAWKDGLVASIAARINAEPIEVVDAAQRMQTSPDVEYLRVTARGIFLHEDERLLYAPDPRLGPGYHVFTPLLLSSRMPGPRAGCRDYVLVNRGFVPETLKLTDKRRTNRDARGDLVVGLARLPERPGFFTPANDLKNNLWFWRDLAGMAASLQRPPTPDCISGPRAVPFFIDAETEDPRVNPDGWPKGGTTTLVIPNRHLEYALTWYGLAATLIGVFVVFAWGRLRSSGTVSSL